MISRLLKKPSGVILRAAVVGHPEGRRPEGSSSPQEKSTARFFATLRMTALRVFQQPVRRFVLVCVSLMWAAHLLAGTSLKVLNWDDCVRIASENNPDLTATKKAFLAARADYDGSLNGYFPTLTLSNSFNDSSAHARDSRWQAQAQAGMNLFNPTTNANIRRASAALAQAEAGYVVSSSNVRNALRQAFAKLLFAQESIRVAEVVQRVRRSNAKMVALKYESGRESKGNMLRAKAEAAQADADFAVNNRNLRVAQQELNRQLGQDEYEAIMATGTLAAGSLPPFPHMRPLIEGHPRVSAQTAIRAASLAGLKSARAALWPFLSAQYSRGFSEANYFPDENPHWSASAVLSYRLFGGGLTSTYHAVASAKRSLEASDQNLRSVRNQVRYDLEEAWAGLANSLDQVLVQRQFLEAARQRNEEALVRYTSGLSSFEDWEQAVGDFVNSEKSMIQTERDAVIAEAAWIKALGKPLEDN